MDRPGGAIVKPDHGRYLAMIELQKTDNLIRLSLYELIRVLLREYMAVFTIFQYFIVENPRRRLHVNCVPMREQNNDEKGYFFRAGQCAALSSFRVGKMLLL